MRQGISPQMQRSVFARDTGICQVCGVDCDKITRVYWAIRDTEAQWFYGDIVGFLDQRKRYWEVDHIHEVAAGGGNEIANLQTLCPPCHREKTNQFLARRAAQREWLFTCAPGCDDTDHICKIITELYAAGMQGLPFDVGRGVFEIDGPPEAKDLFVRKFKGPCLAHYDGCLEGFHFMWDYDTNIEKVTTIQ